MIELFAALPGVAAVGIGTARWRAWRYPERGWRRASPGARLALFAAFALAIGACHSIDENAFAHSPVPLTALPLHEPLTYSFGVNRGQVVPLQPGLLASYFAGAQYDRLDHQQIDPNVDFVWNGAGNPVITAPDGIDHNDGDFRLPDSWGIWSVVWEGYLLAPADGTYLLRIHVNNGGWLEMKDSSGALATVIDCPGGTSFEGDCDASTTLTAGPQYIRFSYYNNAPPSANAILSWQPPGASSVDVVPTSALQTQLKPSSQRSFIFVHGILGSADDGESFKVLLSELKADYPAEGQVTNFRYFQDLGDANLATTTCTKPATFDPPLSPALPLNLSTHSIDPSICDSQSNVGISAVLLDKDVRRAHAKFGGPVTIIANSMGGAITRAFLAYATDVPTGAADPGVISDIFFLQGAQEGSYLAYAKPVLVGLLAPAGPASEIVFDGAAEVIRRKFQFDGTRPAIDDLLPVFSDTYRYVNPSVIHIPNHIRYFNVASDIRWSVRVDIANYTFPIPLRFSFDSTTPSFGDYVMLQGSDDPTSLPLLGGERFLPSSVNRGQLSHQWILRHDVVTSMSETITYIPLAPEINVNYDFPGDPFGVPESHLALGSKLDKIVVTDRVTGESLPLNKAIIREITRQGP